MINEQCKNLSHDWNSERIKIQCDTIFQYKTTNIDLRHRRYRLVDITAVNENDDHRLGNIT